MATQKKKTSRKPAAKRDAPQRDPHARREADRYEQPIASRELILKVLEDLGRPAYQDEIETELHIRSEQDQEALRRRLRAMVRDGQLVFNRRGGFCLAGRIGVVAGRVQAHRDGFGFLIPDEGGEDIFLSPRQMQSVMHGDRISVRISGIDRRGRPEGSLVDVLERNTETLVGRFFEEGGVGFVSPDNSRFQHDVLIPATDRFGAKHGQIVLVDLVEYPGPHTQPLGRIARVLGDHRAAGMEVEIAIHSFGLPHEFPDAVVEEAEAFGAEVPEAAKAGRIDLRDVDLVTIDGEDARDFDDAVYCEPLRDGGWRLIVAIADVAHYVKPGNALDVEAEKRGTSVYFPDWVIPMLPEALSNGLCSLNPKVDRLCMACDMRIDAAGKVTRAKFYDAVMRSKARLTYTKVANLVEKGDVDVHRELGPLVDRLHALHDLYQALAKARRRRGAIDFDRPETRIIFDENRKIEAIKPTERNVAHKIIEECMIAANVQAAKFLDKNKVPTLYRVHDGPKEESITNLREFLGPLGLSLGGGENPQPKDYAKLIEKIQDRPDRFLIETVLLRSLSQAVYQPKPDGHFGLSLEHYAHFTSPIRRYPDLLVHRGLKLIANQRPKKEFGYDHRRMETLGTHTSMTERRADEATRDAVAWLKCDFMVDKVGEEYDGIITGVTNFGLFVELNEMQIEGLIHVTSLENDYYRHDPAQHRLVGERGGKVYRLSDAIRVRVVRVNPDERKIDFEPANAAAGSDVARADKTRGDGKKTGRGPGKKKTGKKKSSAKRGSPRGRKR
ncbi:MAG TPA: ribonuclease R [Gammaproteobacteria bacterium]